jgi:DNA (cytosine-5)-methyltransferase 1
MVQPREQFRAQRFPDTYRLHDNKSQQTAQAGNVVPVNVAQWICHHIRTALDQAA